MAMNQPSPEILAQLMGQGQGGGEPPVEGPQTPEEQAAFEQEAVLEAQDAQGGLPDESMGQMPPEIMQQLMMGMQQPSPSSQQQPMNIDPTMILPEVVVEYMNYALGIMQDEQLDKKIQSDILVQQAQALSSLVPLLQNDAEMEMQKMQMEMEFKQQEMEMKREEMAMNLEMKQAEMGMKQQEHEMKLQHSQAENQMKLQQQQETHAHKLVQGQQSHETKMEQQKQAAQSKQDSKPSSNSGS